jgi:hypothetical protein
MEAMLKIVNVQPETIIEIRDAITTIMGKACEEKTIRIALKSFVKVMGKLPPVTIANNTFKSISEEEA